MKKYFLTLGVLPLFFGLVSAHDCGNLNGLHKAIMTRMDDVEYQMKLIDARTKYVTDIYEWNYLKAQLDLLGEERDEVQSDADYYKQEQAWCDKQGDIYNSYIDKADSYKKQLADKGSYDSDLVDRAVYYLEEALDILEEAKFSNATKMRNAVQDDIDSLIAYQDTQEARIKAEKKAEEQARKEAEQKAADDALLNARANFCAAEEYLGWKTSIMDSIVVSIGKQTKKKQAQVLALIKDFQTSKDEYTRHIGNYLDYKLNYE